MANSLVSGGMVHVNVTTIECIWNDCDSSNIVLMIVSCFIQFPTNVRMAGSFKMAFGDRYMYQMKLCMLARCI